VNLALPFYRDSKLRVAGNTGVWESPFQEEEFQPIINPWFPKVFVNCMTDTLQFEDHSIINHDGVLERILIPTKFKSIWVKHIDYLSLHFFIYFR